MTAKRVPLNRSRGNPRVEALELALVHDQPLPERQTLIEDATVWAWTREISAWAGVTAGKDLWLRHRDAVLAAWIENFPGSRPSGWWRWDAPGPRQRCGGIGFPWSDVLHLGVPAQWNYGRQRGLGPNPPRAVDPAHPPTYESEATFLARHGLLSPSEKRRLRADDYRPISILEILGLDENRP